MSYFATFNMFEGVPSLTNTPLSGGQTGQPLGRIRAVFRAR